MNNRPAVSANEKGAVIVVAMIILALLTLIGISATTTSTMEMNIASNDQQSKMVFYAADGGIEVGRQILNSLKAANPASWDSLLSGSAFTWHDSSGDPVTVSSLNQAVDATARRQIGSAAFTLQVVDNDDLDGNPLVDTDDTLLLTSTGIFRNARAQIQVMVRYTGPADAYAQEHYDNRKSGTNSNENADVANNLRW